MIRTNLATRPFYNAAAVRFWLTVAVALVVVATAFNVTQVLRSSNTNTELMTRAANDEARAAELRTNAQRLRASVNVAEVDAVSVDARQANDLIERRVFSWTELFNRFERTLPPDVRITAVRPTIDKQRRIVLAVDVLARSVDDVNRFMENLDGTGAFSDLHSRAEEMTDDEQIHSSLEMVYQTTAATAGAAAPPAAAPAAAPTPAAPAGGRR